MLFIRAFGDMVCAPVVELDAAVPTGVVGFVPFAVFVVSDVRRTTIGASDGHQSSTFHPVFDVLVWNIPRRSVPLPRHLTHWDVLSAVSAERLSVLVGVTGDRLSYLCIRPCRPATLVVDVGPTNGLDKLTLVGRRMVLVLSVFTLLAVVEVFWWWVVSHLCTPFRRIQSHSSR